MALYVRSLDVAAVLMLASANQVAAECGPDWTNAREAMADYDLVFSGTLVALAFQRNSKSIASGKATFGGRSNSGRFPAKTCSTSRAGDRGWCSRTRGVSVEELRRQGATKDLAPIYLVSLCSPTRPHCIAVNVIHDRVVTV